MKAEWLFFDMGSTLVDESRAEFRRIRDTVAGTDVTYGQFLAAALPAYGEGRNGYYEALDRFGLRKAAWRGGEERPYPGARELLERLRGRYRLGVVANQPPGSEDRLRGFGLREYFDFVIASAEAGVSKPDPRIFRLALERAGCAPGLAVMVGDRVDNDVAPAKALGLRTVWVRQGFWARLAPRSPEETPDGVIDSLEELCALLE